MLRSEWDRNHSATRLHRTPEQSDTRERHRTPGYYSWSPLLRLSERL